MRSAFLLGCFFIGHSLMHIRPEIIDTLAAIMVGALIWDIADSIITWRK